MLGCMAASMLTLVMTLWLADGRAFNKQGRLTIE